MLIMVDLDADTMTPMMIGELFRGHLLKVGESRKWSEIRDMVIDSYIRDDYQKDARVFFSDDAARKRFAKDISFDSFGFFSGFPADREEEPVQGDRWTHCVQYLFEEEIPGVVGDDGAPVKHLFSCLWITEVDAYMRNTSRRCGISPSTISLQGYITGICSTSFYRATLPRS